MSMNLGETCRFCDHAMHIFPCGNGSCKCAPYRTPYADAPKKDDGK
jgi:hypothetical protein